MDDPRDRLARRLGVEPGYTDQTGTWHETGPATRDAILSAVGAPTEREAAERRLAELEAEADARPVEPWVVIEADAPSRLDGLSGHGWSITLEDGTVREGEGADLGEIPLGIHEMRAGDHLVWLLAAPRRLRDPKRGWGVTLPLYGIGAGGAIGTYRDLGEAVASLGQAGADFVGINPIHAGFSADPNAFSPYAPSHRSRLSALHVAPDRETPPVERDLLDYDAAVPTRLEALRRDWDGGDDAFRGWREAQGRGLELFALHQALAEKFGPYWRNWPDPYRSHESGESRTFAGENADAVSFHAWLQYRAERQLAEVQEKAEAAGMAYGLYLDLAVGTHPDGAETWADPGLFGLGVSLGAPPDAFSAEGQSWGLAPLRPDTLAERGFRPLAAILRRQLAHARLLRIDHILGFDRAFWQPGEGVPGAYVKMPLPAMLAVVRIEAARAGAATVGEDLGNIPEGLQQALAESGILGCRVAQFEQHWDEQQPTFKTAGEYDAGALTSFTTHDLPTWRGWQQGRDIEWRHQLGTMDGDQCREATAHRMDEVRAFHNRIGGSGLSDLNRFLARTPSRLVALQIEDLLGQIEQPNLPGTVHEHPNWRRRIHVPPAELGQLDALREAASIMQDADR